MSMTTIDSQLKDVVRRLRRRSEGPNTLDDTMVATLRSHQHQAAQAGEPVLLGSASRFFCNSLGLGLGAGPQPRRVARLLPGDGRPGGRSA
jgi:hypothetical protein